MADRYAPRSNAFGLLRLILALTVLVAHSQTLGFGAPALGLSITRGQTDLGTFAVKGFFLISGFLITSSALRLSWPRYLWHRFLRIMPAFWVCLVVTAFAFAPLAAYLERGNLHGLWRHPEGPGQYVILNAFLAMDQYRIAGLLATTPYGHLFGGPSYFDGSLWTLRYEAACYVLIAVLSATAVLHRARRAVLLLTIGCLALTFRDLHTSGQWAFHPVAHPEFRPLPMLGFYTYDQALYLVNMFLLGACAYLYRHRIPMHGALAAVAGLVVVVTGCTGGFLAVGLPAFAYLLLYVAVASPPALHGVGSARDYSYGIYIYAFPVQQLLALAGATRFGPVGYLASTLVVTFGLAALSWHLVERPALGLKNARSPEWLRARSGAAPETVEPPVARQPEPAQTAQPQP